MDENQTTQTQENSGGSAGKVIAIIILVLLIVAVVVGLFVQPDLLTKLTRSFSKTQNQVENVQEETAEAQQEVVSETQEGLQEVGQAISEVDNPLIRLMLAKAYATKLTSALSEQGKEDLNTVIVYVEKQPEILIQPTPAWPAEVKAALTRLQTEIAKAKVKSVAVSLIKAIEDANSKVGDSVKLTGLWESTDQAETLGSVFMLTDSTSGQVYYFQMSGTAAENAMELVGSEVTVTVKITSEEDGYVTYDVVSGPTEVPVTTPTESVEE